MLLYTCTLRDLGSLCPGFVSCLILFLFDKHPSTSQLVVCVTKSENSSVCIQIKSRNCPSQSLSMHRIHTIRRAHLHFDSAKKNSICPDIQYILNREIREPIKIMAHEEVFWPQTLYPNLTIPYQHFSLSIKLSRITWFLHKCKHKCTRGSRGP